MYYRNIFQGIKRYKISNVIKILILSDFIIWSSSNLITPLMAVFITQELGVGIEVAGIAVSILLITQALLETPIALLIDRTKSERDDLLTVVCGGLIMGMGYILMIFVESVWQLYVLQAVIGMGVALSYPGWSALFTSHIDKRIKAFEWSLEDTVLGIGTALTAALGGFLVKEWGYDVIFIIVGSFQMIGGFLLLLLEGKVKK